MKNTAFFDPIEPEADVFCAFNLDSAIGPSLGYKQRKALRQER